SISNSAFIFETKRDLFVVNDETLQLSHVTWVQSASICFNKCSDKISDISKMVSEFSEDSQKCSCFICSRGKLRDFSDPEESKGKSRTYSSELTPTTEVENPCETGHHFCSDLATCSFNGDTYFCLCPPHLNGNGFFCTSYRQIDLGHNADISANNLEYPGPINVLHDLNVGKRPGSVQCLNMSSSENEGGPWEIRIEFEESTFVKSVGIFNDDGQYQ
ncbi:uncharacterized protein LOC142355506, partial [Convolutriloba macropyga]|uniref:uncharacterized protein LOC142355506 n=1 Tax=Convolutriloba macropyga TaxID=536237 RepID=UPI003F51D63B